MTDKTKAIVRIGIRIGPFWNLAGQKRRSRDGLWLDKSWPAANNRYCEGFEGKSGFVTAGI
jgi:hypothetical protein